MLTELKMCNGRWNTWLEMYKILHMVNYSCKDRWKSGLIICDVLTPTWWCMHSVNVDQEFCENGYDIVICRVLEGAKLGELFVAAQINLSFVIRNCDPLIWKWWWKAAAKSMKICLLVFLHNKEIACTKIWGLCCLHKNI